jgi:class 3 adenylate cyclase
MNRTITTYMIPTLTTITTVMSWWKRLYGTKEIRTSNTTTMRISCMIVTSVVSVCLMSSLGAAPNEFLENRTERQQQQSTTSLVHRIILLFYLGFPCVIFLISYLCFQLEGWFFVIWNTALSKWRNNETKDEESNTKLDRDKSQVLWKRDDLSLYLNLMQSSVITFLNAGAFVSTNCSLSVHMMLILSTMSFMCLSLTCAFPFSHNLVVVCQQVNALIFITINGACWSVHWNFSPQYSMVTIFNSKSLYAGIFEVFEYINTSTIAITACFACLFSTVIIRMNQEKQNLKNTIANLKQEKELADKLLVNVLPFGIAQRMKNGETMIHEVYDNVSVIFADVCDFTKFSIHSRPKDIILALHNLFSEFDKAADKFGVEKIKTIGDAYLAVTGLPHRPTADHATLAVRYGLEMIKIVEQYNMKHNNMDTTPFKLEHRSQDDAIDELANKPTNFVENGSEANLKFKIRVGIASGQIVGGVVGTHKFLFDIFGSVVNLASRMESSGLPMRVQISEETYMILKKSFSAFRFKKRDKIFLKGIGYKSTYLIDSANAHDSTSIT